MVPPDLDKIAQEVERQLDGTPDQRTLEKLAKQLGYVLHKRGKHPTWVRPGRPPLSIPSHGRGIKKHTGRSIARDLQSTVEADKEAEAEAKKESSDGKGKDE